MKIAGEVAENRGLPQRPVPIFSFHTDFSGRDRLRSLVLLAAVTIMTALAALWLGYEFYRLIAQPTELFGKKIDPGAVDLIERYNETRNWFAGRHVVLPIYPPATYLMLWPLLGWASLQHAVLLWALISVIGLGWLSFVIVRETPTQDRLTRVFAGLLPWAMYATGATIGNGQLDLLVLPFLVAGVVTLAQGPATWSRDLRGSLFFLVSLIKPTFTAPFFWIVALALRRWRPAILVLTGYVLLALAAWPFYEGSPLVQHENWLRYGTGSAVYSSGMVIGQPGTPITWPMQWSTNTVQFLLSLVGKPQWTIVATICILGALGLWVYRHRKADTWILLGVSALAARFWTYHRWYDDMLILIPMVTLLRLAVEARQHEGQHEQWTINCLLGALVLTSLPPGGLYVLPPPLDGVYVVTQTLLWLATLVYLHRVARRTA